MGGMSKEVSMGCFQASAPTKKEATEKLQRTIEKFSQDYDPYRVYPGLGEVLVIVVAPTLSNDWSYGFLRGDEVRAHPLCKMHTEEEVKFAAVQHVFEMYSTPGSTEDEEWLRTTCRVMRLDPEAPDRVLQYVAELEEEQRKAEENVANAPGKELPHLSLTPFKLELEPEEDE